MSEMYSNAAVQSANFVPEKTPGKAIPIFVAHWLNDISGASTPMVDLWSNCSAEFDSITHAQQAVSEKYNSNILKGMRSANSYQTHVISDTDYGFQIWAQDLTERLMSEGTLQIESTEVFACNNCGNAISIADSAVAPRFCGFCKNTEIVRVHKQALVSEVNKDAIDKTERAAAGAFDRASYPEHRMVLNKKRRLGIDLESVGFPGEVLDPKVAIGLLAIYAAIRFDQQGIKLVAARSSAAHNIPQLFSFLGSAYDDMPDIVMQPIVKAPTDYLKYLVSDGVISHDRYIDILRYEMPKHLLNMRHDMTPETAERIIFGRKSRIDS